MEGSYTCLKWIVLHFVIKCFCSLKWKPCIWWNWASEKQVKRCLPLQLLKRKTSFIVNTCMKGLLWLMWCMNFFKQMTWNRVTGTLLTQLCVYSKLSILMYTDKFDVCQPRRDFQMVIPLRACSKTDNLGKLFHGAWTYAIEQLSELRNMRNCNSVSVL